MIYKSVSVGNVIARVIRNTRVQDSSYLLDMPEWIAEAAGFMKTRFQYSPRFEDVTINFYKGKLPCDLEHITAVEYDGTRLKQRTLSKHHSTGHNLSIPDLNTIAIATPVPIATEAGTIMWGTQYTEDASVAIAKKEHTFHSYDTEMGVINTTFADGQVRIHYAAHPIDADGYLLIPDNEDYKQALYYYIRGMMIGAGFKDNAFNESELMRRFELHAARAIGQIRYPSVESMEAKVDALVRFIPASNYYENFFKADPEAPL